MLYYLTGDVLYKLHTVFDINTKCMYFSKSKDSRSLLSFAENPYESYWLIWYCLDINLISFWCRIYVKSIKNRPGINFKFTDLYIGPRIFALYMYMQCERKIISHHRVPRSHDYRIWALNDDKARHKICRTHTVPVLLLKLLMLNHMH